MYAHSCCNCCFFCAVFPSISPAVLLLISKLLPRHNIFSSSCSDHDNLHFQDLRHYLLLPPRALLRLAPPPHAIARRPRPTLSPRGDGPAGDQREAAAADDGGGANYRVGREGKLKLFGNLSVRVFISGKIVKELAGGRGAERDSDGRYLFGGGLGGAAGTGILENFVVRDSYAQLQDTSCDIFIRFPAPIIRIF